MLKFYNGLTNRKEDFIPLDSQVVKVYVCGPTVYNDIHIGNARSMVNFDVLFRLLRYMYPRVIMVRNLTDIDDKINRRAQELRIPAQELTQQVIDDLHKQIMVLGVLPVTYEPRVTEHLPEIIALIQSLLDNGIAYESAGHILFAVDRYSEYGKLSHRTLADMNVGASARVSDTEISIKRHPLDFVLWKPKDDADAYAMSFTSPWGVGRPGWHIECSAMSHKYLGDDFDIHAGGMDLKFPHHENEIAQSCCGFPGSQFAKYWLHNGMMTINGEKMSKSLGNVITLRKMLDDLSPIHYRALRLLFLSSQYRQSIDYTQKLLQDSLKMFDHWHQLLGEQFLADYRQQRPSLLNFSEQQDQIFSIGLELLANDLNTPALLAYLQQLNKNPEANWSLAKLLDLLGLLEPDYFVLQRQLSEAKTTKIDAQLIEQLVAERQVAKQRHDWSQADALRQQLTALGVELQDTPTGTV